MASTSLRDAWCNYRRAPDVDSRHNGNMYHNSSGCSSSNKKRRRRPSSASVPLPAASSSPPPLPLLLRPRSRPPLRDRPTRPTATATAAAAGWAAWFRDAAAAATGYSVGVEEEEESRLQSSPRRGRRRRRQQPQPPPPAAAAAAGVGAGKGFLFRVTKAAAVTAVAVAVTRPVGAVALVTEAQCKGVTLLGTQAELEGSPRLDTSTEAAAAGIDRTVVATQETYDRMQADQLAITLMEGRDVPFRNTWSDHVWLGTAKVTFPGTAVMASLEEGIPPDFDCMNKHYGLSFEKGDAGRTVASGTLTANKVLNWSLLGPEYLALDGVTAFDPTDVQTLPPTTYLVAARTEVVGKQRTPDFHYFLAEPAKDVDPSDCPDPCTGEVVSYFWSASAGAVHLLDRASSKSVPRPCWLGLLEAVADGPPAGGVDPALVDNTYADCTLGLLYFVEEDYHNGAMAGVTRGGGGGDGNLSGDGDGVVVVSAVLVPLILVGFVAVAFGVLRRQQGRRLHKMKTTDEAWGGGLDGNGGEKGPRPPTGRFKLGIGSAAVTAETTSAAAGADRAGDEWSIPRLKSFPLLERKSTDVSIDIDAHDLASGGRGGVMAAGAWNVVSPDDGGRSAEEEDDTDADGGRGEDRLYPLQ